MRIFLDANVLFTAAHNPDGKAALIIELGSSGSWSLFSGSYALEEARRNLERKFPSYPDRLSNLQQPIRIIEHNPKMAFTDGLVVKDQPIFQAALACQATHLLTGDLKDFSPFIDQPDATYGVCIQTVSEFLRNQSK